MTELPDDPFQRLLDEANAAEGGDAEFFKLGTASLDMQPVAVRVYMACSMVVAARTILVEGGFSSFRSETLLFDLLRKLTGLAPAPAQ